ncbi:GNAT family N-acetyltransferase [Nafulsella turpanensis]|uniref:GNAT family N-acetyltransferase n=1 Tax=Nafulsella turpanensis TaxID=1265690 RepID=UPI000344A81B|nr:GNAT family N-acetyltransferase [Nafulsella turpanensis]
MHTLKIKKATLADLEELQFIGRQTFTEAFAADNTAVNMQKYLSEQFSLQQLTDEISHPDSEFYLATYNHKTIGYLKVNFGQAQKELQDEQALEIERIYVLKEFHGKGVGQLLFDKALQLAREKNAPYVWLGVWEKNPRAIHFYRKNGLQEFDRHHFILGDDEQTDIMMKLELS